MAVTFRSSSTATNSSSSFNGTTLVFNAPAGLASGDLLIAAVYFSSNVTAPSGWTAYGALTMNGLEAGQLFAKIAGPSEPSTYTWTSTGGGGVATGAMLDYFGNAAIDVEAQTSTGGSPRPTSYAAPSVNTSQANEVVVALWIGSNEIAITLPGGLTSRASVVGNFGAIVAGDYTGPVTPGSTSPGTASQGSANDWAAFTVAIKVTQPLAPTLTAPTNGAYTDVYDNGGPFVWAYNTGGGTGGETGYQFRRKTTGAYTYWNASTPAFQSSAVTNTSTSTSLTFPATVWANDTTYNWSVASQDSTGLGAFASDFTVNTQFAPAVSPQTPAGTWGTNNTPTITWLDTLDPLATQGTYRVVTYSAAQYGAVGFTPGSGASLDDSGVVSSTALSYTTANTIPNNTTVRSYIQITQSPGGQVSPWVFTSYTISLNTPAAPTITALATTDPTTGMPLIQLTVQGQDNYLTANQAAFVSGNTTGWTAGSNTTISAVTSPPPPSAEGTYSMQMAPTATGTISANTATGTAGVVVIAGNTYTALASFRSASTARACTVGISWYNSAGTLLSTTTSSSTNDSSSAWTQVTLLGTTAPANAAFAAVVVTVAAANEDHFVAEVALVPGTTNTWARGGLVGSTSAIILRSDNTYVRNASPANPALITNASQQTVINDYEATPGTQYQYTAVIQATISGNLLSSPTAFSNVVTLTTTQWWEIDPTTPSTAVGAQVTVWNPQTTEQSAAHIVMGQVTPNILANVMGGTDGSAEFQTFNTSSYIGLTSLLTSQKTIFISDPFGLSYYVRFGPSTGATSGSGGNTVLNAQLQASTGAAPYKITQANFVAQPKPPV